MRKLYTLITDPPIEWLRPRHVFTFWVPTVHLVTMPTIVAPIQGRYWEIDLYRRGDRLISYAELKTLEDFHGTSHETQIYLYEVWHDCGNDGHTHYQLAGWLLHPGLYTGEPHQIVEAFPNLFPY